ncbi:hypothetical protein GCM10008914_09410 [Clostridium tertium]
MVIVLFTKSGEDEFDTSKFIMGSYSLVILYLFNNEGVIKLLTFCRDFLSNVFTFQFLPKSTKRINPRGGNIIKINIHDKVFSGRFFANIINISIIKRFIINDR